VAEDGHVAEAAFVVNRARHLYNSAAVPREPGRFHGYEAEGITEDVAEEISLSLSYRAPWQGLCGSFGGRSGDYVDPPRGDVVKHKLPDGKSGLSGPVVSAVISRVHVVN